MTSADRDLQDVPTTTRLPLDSSQPDPRFREEMQVTAWLMAETATNGHLPVAEAVAVTHSAFVGMRLDGSTTLPMLPLADMSEYSAVHALNTAILAMGLAEFTGLDEEAVRAVGLAGLLHDIGMVRIPLVLLAKSDQLESAERDLIREHPAEGARILVEADATLELAAVVAYEHHIRIDGSGYPVFRYPRATHPISRLVQVCDTYHALRSPRPFREAWPQDIVFSFMNQRAGFEFDAEYVGALTSMIKSWN